MTEATTHPRLHIPIELRWGDLDAYNHVNNTSMLKLLEEARIRAFWKPIPGEDAPPTAIIDSSVGAGLQIIMARQEVEYIRPVLYQRRPLDVQMWFASLGGSSVEICYEVHSPRGAAEHELYARSSAVLVLVDEETGRPKRLPEEFREAWGAYLGPRLEYDHRR